MDAAPALTLALHGTLGFGCESSGAVQEERQKRGLYFMLLSSLP